MAIVSNDPTRWPTINACHFSSYFAVATFIAVTYDCGEHDNIKGVLIAYKSFSALTFGQEVKLVWRQWWSLMAVMYLSVRYLGILSAVLFMVGNVLTISLTDTVNLLYRCLPFSSD
ncbi:hypothetical protein BDR06DRAFT_1012984 [Suillus hirtellus]|nr:hypothetical protein BDR06DRAFT_1012984 [Suillus hirtellus]